MYLKINIKNCDELRVWEDRAVFSLIKEKEYYDLKAECREFLVDALISWMRTDLNRVVWEADLDLSDTISPGISKHIANIFFDKDVDSSKDRHLIFNSFLMPQLVSAYVFVCREISNPTLEKFKNIDDIIVYLIKQGKGSASLENLFYSSSYLQVGFYLYLYYFGDDEDCKKLTMGFTDYNGPQNLVKSYYLNSNKIMDAVPFMAKYKDEFTKLIPKYTQFSSGFQNAINEAGIKVPEKELPKNYFSNGKIILKAGETYLVAGKGAAEMYRVTNENMILGVAENSGGMFCCKVLAHHTEENEIGNSWPVEESLFNKLTYVAASELLHSKKIPFSFGV